MVGASNLDASSLTCARSSAIRKSYTSTRLFSTIFPRTQAFSQSSAPCSIIDLLPTSITRHAVVPIWKLCYGSHLCAEQTVLLSQPPLSCLQEYYCRKICYPTLNSEGILLYGSLLYHLQPTKNPVGNVSAVNIALRRCRPSNRHVLPVLARIQNENSSEMLRLCISKCSKSK